MLGRLSECDLTLRDSRISRRHARIRFESGVYTIEDLQSRHGITVNGERVERRRLAVGDRIGFGVEKSFVVHVAEETSPRAPLLRKVSVLAEGRGEAGPLGRLAAMLEVARTVTSSEGVEEVFDAVVEAALAITGAERAYLLLREDSDNSGGLRVRAARDSSSEGVAVDDLGVPLGVIVDALDRRKDLFSVTVPPMADEVSEARDGHSAALRRNTLCVPILRIRIGRDNETTVISARRHTLGALYVDSRDPQARLAEGNQALLQALAIEISTVLENARLIAEEGEKRRLDQELRMARGIQQALQPPALPVEGWLVAKGHSEPRSQLGGDYYDLMPVAPGKWAAVVADVSGKGVAASLLASLMQGAFFLGSGPDLSIPDILGRINRYLCERSAETRFVTVFALVVEENGAVRWSNAGHCPALLVRASGAVEWLEPNSRPVGLFEDSGFAEDACRLHSGDKLVIYTDGVSEARSPAGEQLGEKRLAMAAAASARLGTAAFFDALLAAVRDFADGAPSEDDLTLLALGFKDR